ncbi:MAG: PorT family protein [Prevotella sp.]|jgi:hypothetical protein|nr:PorT family protein [Prevotella sp.]
MQLYKKTVWIIALCISTSAIKSQTDMRSFSHKIIAGYNIGATLPNNLSREIRSIDAYWPQFTPQLGYNVSYRFAGQWSAESGIALDLKGMGVRDKVKYMYTDVNMDGNNIKGYFTGRNETEIKITYVTIPIRVSYHLNETWSLKLGVYASYRSSAEFSGTVWDGYLRKTEDKDILNSELINIGEKDVAVFDFGKDLRTFDFGISMGFEHCFNRKFGVYTEATYSLTPIFPKSFTGIDMKMRNIYITAGMTYKI